MASRTVLGALRIILGADASDLDKGLKAAEARLSSFAGNVGKAAAAIAAGMTIAVGAVGAGVAKALKQADELGKSAQKIGIPVEELSALKHAADLSDVSMETLSKSVGKLSKTMVEAAAKPTSEAANAFRALGISATNADGSLKSSSEVMTEVAGKFEGMKDGAGKTAAAMALFGRSGADLIPMLNSGKVGLAAMIDEARKLGIVIDSETAKSAEAFNDNLTRLGKVKDGIILKITAGMLPALEGFSTRLIEGAKNSTTLQSIVSALATAFQGLVRGVLLVADNLGFLVKVGAAYVGLGLVGSTISMGVAFVKFAAAIRLAGLATAAFNAISALSRVTILAIAGAIALATGNFETLTAKMGELGQKMAAMLPANMGDGLTSGLKAMGLDVTALTAEFGKLGPAVEQPKKVLTDFNYAAMGGKNALDQLFASTRKQIAAQTAEAQTVGALGGAREKLKFLLQAETVAKEDGIVVTEALRLKMTQLADAYAVAALKVQGAQLTQEMLLPWETYNQKLQRNLELLQQGAISAETYERANRKVAEDAATAWDIAGASIAGSFADIAGAFGKENSAMATAAKVFGGIQALISTYTGAAKALELPFPANIAAMATVLAKGMSFVASIRGTSVPKFATGGMARVAGAGGIDSKRVTMDVSPGELIEVHQNAYGSGGDLGGRGGAGTYILRGYAFSRDQIRDLFDTINAGLRDGHKLDVSFA